MHEPPGKSAGTGCAVELEAAFYVSVRAHAPAHRLVLHCACLAQLCANGHELTRLIGVELLYHVRDHGFVQTCDGDALLLVQPVLYLRDALGVIQPRQRDGLFGELGLVPCVEVERVAHELRVHSHAAFVYPCVQAPETVLGLVGLPAQEHIAYMPLGHDVLPVILNELRPLFGCVFGVVSLPAAVGRGRLARAAEVFNERLARLVLGLVLRQPQR